MPLSKPSLRSVLVTLPNSVVHNFNLPESATGMDCLEMVCSQLGVVEVDYFGLRYIDHHGIYLWVNLRMNLAVQIKTASPAQLYLKVKYFVDPQTLQQPSTKHLFYLQIKSLMAKGQLPIPVKEASKFGALIAQSDFGNSSNLNNKLCYPQYFKDWAPGIARGIAKEHSKLSGIETTDAENMFLTKAFKLENWGVSYVKATNTEDNSSCYVGIGGLHIRICNTQWRLVKKISYDYLQEASFRNKIFTISYRSVGHQGEHIDKQLFFRCPHHRIARYLFRLLTEDHTFFCHETVSERVLDHVRIRPWQQVCKKYFGRTYHRVYHFDVIRTQHEAYSHAWERLHQVNQESLNNRLATVSSAAASSNGASTATGSNDTGTSSQSRERGENSTSFTDNETNRDCIDTNVLLPESPSEFSRVNLIQFGLSKSSCDIAKELLETPEDQSTSTFTGSELQTTKQDPSKDDSETAPPSPQTERRGSVCLTKEGTIKLGQFIQKIVDSKLCRVCMDSPVSAVFCPCGHLISCYKCALECTQCPLCRSTIAYVQYVYGSGL